MRDIVTVALVLVLLAFKLVGVVPMNWVWVVAPLWVPPAVRLVVAVGKYHSAAAKKRSE